MSRQVGELVSWECTTLWRKLQKSRAAEAKSVRATIDTVMPKVQTLLCSGGTALTDFTLHDHGHAFRVSERMADIVPPDVVTRLSTYEIALLLLAAYLHDIGMVPEQHKVNELYWFLLSGDAKALDEVEMDLFQSWLDDDGRADPFPLRGQTPNAETIQLAQELLTHYARSRHNDWGADWIKGNLSSHELGTYSGWIDDLVALCKSHHEGYAHLCDSRFNPRIVGSPARVVHLRYLATVLRVADILEFDPERTPDVVFRHRSIAIYWWKDKEISTILEGGRRMLMSARPLNAIVHRAVERTADDVDKELLLARNLADETHFDKAPYLNQELPHRWDLMPLLQRDIRPRNDEYEYIDGAFRPDGSKLIQLFSGLTLYSSPYAAVRELLQNAFDAARERIAYQRLSSSTPSDGTAAKRILEAHEVTLRIEVSPNAVWLVCRDTGAGMTKRIIRDYLLVSGNSRRHDVMSLERRCREAGFTLGRTGQFGVGVLSYFMIADRVVFLTRRCQEAGDGEATGWSFQTDGVGSFGELRRSETRFVGTEVRMRLRSKYADEIEDWSIGLRAYLANALLRVPCRFQFRTTLPDCPAFPATPGWVEDREKTTTALLRSIAPERVSAEAQRSGRRRSVQDDKAHWAKVYREARDGCKLLQLDGELPEGLGRYRIRLPYWELPGGGSLGFFRLSGGSSTRALKRIGKGYLFVPWGRTRVAWKGMLAPELKRHDLEAEMYPPHADIVTRDELRRGFALPRSADLEIDLTSADAAELSVSRDRLILKDAVNKALKRLREKVRTAWKSFLCRHQTSEYFHLNVAIFEQALPNPMPLRWLVPSRGESVGIWGKVRFPAIVSTAYDRIFVPSRPPVWKGKEVHVTPLVYDSYIGTDHSRSFSWCGENSPPHRIVAFWSRNARIACMWTANRTRRQPKCPLGTTCSFPPSGTTWHWLCGIRMAFS